jgi:hypothetical protein
MAAAGNGIASLPNCPCPLSLPASCSSLGRRIGDLLDQVDAGNQVVAVDHIDISEDITTARRDSDITAWVNVIHGCNEKVRQGGGVRCGVACVLLEYMPRCSAAGWVAGRQAGRRAGCRVPSN